MHQEFCYFGHHKEKVNDDDCFCEHSIVVWPNFKKLRKNLIKPKQKLKKKYSKLRFLVTLKKEFGILF